MSKLTRRNFLLSFPLITAGISVPQKVLSSLETEAKMPPISDAEAAFLQRDAARLDMWGRITEWGTPVRQSPGLGKEVALFLGQNTVFPILETIEAEGPNPHNTTWYRMPEGYVYTDRVQVLEPYRMPTIHTQIATTIDGAAGFWAKVIVPYTSVLLRPNGVPYRIQDPNDDTLEITVIAYYDSVHRIIGVEQDSAGFIWYEVFNDKPGDPRSYYMLARHLRMIPPEAFAPINPGVDKYIEMNLNEQRLTCFEDGEPVLSVLTSSGGEGFGTPPGEHAVVYKQPSRYMYSDPENEAFSDPNFFDLPGVPFTVFFTTLGHAIHGTYWHGDYGRPRSHGCLNVTPSVSQWIYRWVEPFAPYDSAAVGSAANPGTPIIVI